MGLLDYYRQFQEMDEEEINRGLRERRAREKALALQQIPELDLSSTEWHELPHSEVVNAAIARARGGAQHYPDRHAERVRLLLAERHAVDAEQIVVGNGAAELLQAAARALLGPGDELVTPWPSYPLFPLMASRVGARPVAVDLAAGRVDPARIHAAIGPSTRAIAICNPNEPTGTYLDSARLAELIDALPEHVHVLLDEAFADFQDAEERDACLRLVARFPRLVVFRTFSKAWGLAALRAGYAVASPDSARLLDAISPVLGVNALTQAAVEHALRECESMLGRRRALVLAARARLVDALHDVPVDAPETQASFVWLRASGLSGAELAARLEREKVIVAPGGPLGDDDHVRAAVHDPRAVDRLVAAIRAATHSRNGA
jgi:histidinol-phosphate aminotransferase